METINIKQTYPVITKEGITREFLESKGFNMDFDTNIMSRYEKPIWVCVELPEYGAEDYCIHAENRWTGNSIMYTHRGEGPMSIEEFDKCLELVDLQKYEYTLD